MQLQKLTVVNGRGGSSSSSSSGVWERMRLTSEWGEEPHGTPLFKGQKQKEESVKETEDEDEQKEKKRTRREKKKVFFITLFLVPILSNAKEGKCQICNQIEL